MSDTETEFASIVAVALSDTFRKELEKEQDLFREIQETQENLLGKLEVLLKGLRTIQTLPIRTLSKEQAAAVEHIPEQLKRIRQKTSTVEQRLSRIEAFLAARETELPVSTNAMGGETNNQ